MTTLQQSKRRDCGLVIVKMQLPCGKIRRRRVREAQLSPTYLRSMAVDSNNGASVPKIFYNDDENDEIEIVDQADLKEALRVQSTEKSFKVTARIVSKVAVSHANRGSCISHKSPKATNFPSKSHRKQSKIEENTNLQSQRQAKPYGPADLPEAILVPGSSGRAVNQLQQHLIKLGYMQKSDIRWMSGYYGPHTTRAVSLIARNLPEANAQEIAGVYTDRIRTVLSWEVPQNFDKIKSVKKNAKNSWAFSPMTFMAMVLCMICPCMLKFCIVGAAAFGLNRLIFSPGFLKHTATCKFFVLAIALRIFSCCCCWPILAFVALCFCSCYFSHHFAVFNDRHVCSSRSY